MNSRLAIMLWVSASTFAVGFLTLFALEIWPLGRRRVNPPFYLHKAALVILVASMGMLVTTIVTIALLTLLHRGW
jgi:hypothetical protein